MPLTSNDPSPCGGGKIKYVCKDLAADLEKVSRTIEADQRLAAVQQLDALIANKGPRAPFLALKAEVLGELGDEARLEQTIAQFLEQHPENPVALAHAALGAIGQEDFPRAVDFLQQSLESVFLEAAAGSKGKQLKDANDVHVPTLVYEAIGFIGQGLIMGGFFSAARAHLSFQAGLAGGEDPRPIELLSRLNTAPSEPLLLKQDWGVTNPQTTGVSSRIPEAKKIELTVAIHEADVSGMWRRSVDAHHACLKFAPLDPLILRNLAVLHGYLADNEAARAAWRQYSSLPNILAEDAIEAEGIAQLLDPIAETVDEVVVTIPIENVDTTLERLQTDARASAVSIDLNRLAREGSPPPKAVFFLLDRPLAKTSEGLTVETASRIFGEMYLYGRQTDRPARLEFSTRKADDYADRIRALRELLGDEWQEPSGEQTFSRIPLTSAMLTLSWRLPDDSTPQLQEELIDRGRHEVLMNKWPSQPFAVLGGKTPSEAASDPHLTLRVLAAILNLELSGEQDEWSFNFDELRQRLNLPSPGPIDPRAVNIETLPVCRYSRLLVDKLSDDALDLCYRRVRLAGSQVAKRKIAAELVSRESIKGVVRASAFAELAELADTSDEALTHLHQAQQSMIDAGESPAVWLLQELALRWENQELPEWRAVLERIQKNHAKEPGVGQQLFRLLVSMGVLSADGSPGPVMRASQAQAQAAAPAPVSGLWTPGQSAAPAPAAGAGKSGLWLPGT